MEGWNLGNDGSLSEALLARRLLFPDAFEWCRFRGDGNCSVSKGFDVGRGPKGELGRRVGDESGEGIRARVDIGRTGESAREGAMLVVVGWV